MTQPPRPTRPRTVQIDTQPGRVAAAVFSSKATQLGTSAGHAETAENRTALLGVATRRPAGRRSVPHPSPRVGGALSDTGNHCRTGHVLTVNLSSVALRTQCWLPHTRFLRRPPRAQTLGRQADSSLSRRYEKNLEFAQNLNRSQRAKKPVVLQILVNNRRLRQLAAEQESVRITAVTSASCPFQLGRPGLLTKVVVLGTFWRCCQPRYGISGWIHDDTEGVGRQFSGGSGLPRKLNRYRDHG